MIVKEKRLRVSCIVLLFSLFIVGLTHVSTHFTDYPVYTEAALKLIHGNLNIYDVNRNVPGGYYYSYFFALMFIPFALLGTVGRFLFFILFFLCYLKIISFSVERSNIILKLEHRYLISNVSIVLSLYAVNDAFMKC